MALLNSVLDTPDLRAVSNGLMPVDTQFFTEISLDIELYGRFKAIKAAPEFAQLSAAEQKKLNNDLREYMLTGAELSPENQEIFAGLQTESAQLSAQFSQNVMDATMRCLVFCRWLHIGRLGSASLITLQRDAEEAVLERDSKLTGLPVMLWHVCAAAERKANRLQNLACKSHIILAAMQYQTNAPCVSRCNKPM